MYCSVYMDTLVRGGVITESEYEFVLNERDGDNIIEMDVPKDVLTYYYYDYLFDRYEMNFVDWYANESICDDFDRVIGCCGWVPDLKKDVPDLYKVLMEKKMEMKLYDLAKTVYNMEPNQVIDFADASIEAGWYGIRQINPFDNDNLIYLVGTYGGECNTYLYNISGLDDRIGKFCAKEFCPWYNIKEINYINCIAKMLADVFERVEGSVPEIIKVEIGEVEE